MFEETYLNLAAVTGELILTELWVNCSKVFTVYPKIFLISDRDKIPIEISEMFIRPKDNRHDKRKDNALILSAQYCNNVNTNCS